MAILYGSGFLALELACSLTHHIYYERIGLAIKVACGALVFRKVTSIMR